MNGLKLKNQIIGWLEAQPYWFQYAGSQLLESSELNESLVETTYRFLLEDRNLVRPENERIPIKFNKIELAEHTISSDLNLRAVKNIENVNALAPGQSIEVNENLTIVYGNNGSGKSGYIRLLNNAFNSRGDKNMLANVFSEEPSEIPKCDFVFQSTEEPYIRTFPDDKSSYEFSQFAVFDAQSVKVHLDNDNQLNFTPSGFEFFEKVLQLFEELKARLNLDIAKARPNNNFTFHFQNDNEIRLFIQSLSATSNESKLRELAEFSEIEEAQMELIRTKIAEFSALNIQEQLANLERLQREFTALFQQLQSITKILSLESIEYYTGLIDSYLRLQEISTAEGIKSLENYSIEFVGSQPWRNLIIAAREYADHIEQHRWIDDSYPSEDDRCLFCLQPLSITETTLINSYWQFLRSQAEKEFNNVKETIMNTIIALKRINTITFDETTSLFHYLNKLAPELAKRWEELVIDSETIKNNIVKNLENLNNGLPVNQIVLNNDEFEAVSLHFIKEIDTLFAKKPDLEIASLTTQLNYLTDKSLLSIFLPQILMFIESSRWALAAENSLTAFRTNSLTIFQGDLFREHINNLYKEIFDSECSKLKAPNVVVINQQNDKLRTFRKLTIAKKPASQILSEGEQHAISLADFLTEIQLNPFNRGVIFDDPVTSLDHQRRALIAERLGKLSESKQVIIFTHDISFFSKLISYAEINSIPVTKTTIRRIGSSIGIVKPDLPWITQKVKDRIGYLRNGLVKLKKLEKEGQEEEYEWNVKGWYGLLREAWERSVEERLFKGAIERFSGEIHTKPLEKIEVTEELVGMINEGMTQSSNWVHDQAMGLNPTIPDCEKAEKDLELLVEFSEKCKT